MGGADYEGSIWDASEAPRPMAGEWERQQAYLQGIADTVFLLVALGLVGESDPRCVRCGERTGNSVDVFGETFPICEGCE